MRVCACIDETKNSPEYVGMLLQPQRGVQSCLSCTNVVLVWLFKMSARVSRNVMQPKMQGRRKRSQKKKKKRRKAEKEVGGMTEEQKNEGARKSRRLIWGTQRATPFIFLLFCCPVRWSGLFSSRNFQGSPKLAHHSPTLESRVQTTYGTKTISGALRCFCPSSHKHGL